MSTYLCSLTHCIRNLNRSISNYAIDDNFRNYRCFDYCRSTFHLLLNKYSIWTFRRVYHFVIFLFFIVNFVLFLFFIFNYFIIISFLIYINQFILKTFLIALFIFRDFDFDREIHSWAIVSILRIFLTSMILFEKKTDFDWSIQCLIDLYIYL